MFRMLVSFIFIWALLVSSSSVEAAKASNALTVQMLLNIDNQILTNPSLKVAPGTTGRVEQVMKNEKDKLLIEVTPHQMANKLELTFKLSKIRDGVKTLISAPKLVTLRGKTVRISQTAPQGDVYQHFSLDVTAH